MIFFIIWAVLGLVGQVTFMYLMKREYGDLYLTDDKTDWMMLPFQFIMSVLAGPTTFVVLAVVVFFSTKSVDK